MKILDKHIFKNQEIQVIMGDVKGDKIKINSIYIPIVGGKLVGETELAKCLGDDPFDSMVDISYEDDANEKGVYRVLADGRSRFQTTTCIGVCIVRHENMGAAFKLVEGFKIQKVKTTNRKKRK